MFALNLVLIGVACYVVIGVCFAAAFVTKGVSRVDPVAADAPRGFRLLIFPGCAALWPVLLVRWVRACKGGTR